MEPAVAILKFSSVSEKNDVNVPFFKKNSGVSAKKLFIDNLYLSSPSPLQDAVALTEHDGCGSMSAISIPAK